VSVGEIFLIVIFTFMLIEMVFIGYLVHINRKERLKGQAIEVELRELQEARYGLPTPVEWPSVARLNEHVVNSLQTICIGAKNGRQLTPELADEYLEVIRRLRFLKAQS
jgi:hypothetical protein